MKHNNTSLIRQEVFEVGSRGQRVHLFTVRAPLVVDSLIWSSEWLQLSAVCYSGCWEILRTKVMCLNKSETSGCVTISVNVKSSCVFIIHRHSYTVTILTHCDRMDIYSSMNEWYSIVRFHKVLNYHNIQFITLWKLPLYHCICFYSSWVKIYCKQFLRLLTVGLGICYFTLSRNTALYTLITVVQEVFR